MCNDKFKCAVTDMRVFRGKKIAHLNITRESKRWRWPGVGFPPKSFEAVPEGREA